jgi:hypothetical protein
LRSSLKGNSEIASFSIAADEFGRVEECDVGVTIVIE